MDQTQVPLGMLGEYAEVTVLWNSPFLGASIDPSLLLSNWVSSILVVFLSFAIVSLRRYLARGQESIEARLEKTTYELSEQLKSKQDLEFHLAKTISEELQRIEYLAASESNARDGEVIRELVHNIATPLSQVRIYLERGIDNPEFLTRERLKMATNAVVLSQEILDAYRTVETISAAHSRRSRQSALPDLVGAAVEVYASAESKHIELEIDLPNDVGRFGSYYILAVLAPLIQNAVHAAPPSSRIAISCSNLDGFACFVVENRVLQPLKESEVARLNEATEIWGTDKDGRGLGLASVRRLLSRVKGADLTFTQQADVVAARLRLPL